MTGGYPSHMSLSVIPEKRLLLALAAAVIAAVIALIAGMTLPTVAILSAMGFLVLTVVLCVDYTISRHAWRQSNVRMARILPPAFALGAKRSVSLVFESIGPCD